MGKINEKLSAIQAEIRVTKNLHNSFGNYNYRNFESICEAAKPLMQKYKCSLTVSDEIVPAADRIYVKATATLTDAESGESVSVTAFAREAAQKKGMDEAQVTGSASSYARKYAASGLFLLDDNKDADTDEYQKAGNYQQVNQQSSQQVNQQVSEWRSKLEEFDRKGLLDSKMKQSLSAWLKNRDFVSLAKAEKFLLDKQNTEKGLSDAFDGKKSA